MATGKLFLIPTIISDDTQEIVIPTQVRTALPELRHFLVENVRTARRYLSSLKIFESIEPLKFDVLDKDTTVDALKVMFAPIYDGHSIGILSESGCPGIADPGALAVKYAHESEIEVVPLVGPSSIILALMSSGLNGQRFAFHGYLPIGSAELVRTIKDLEKESAKKNQTQIFIETPYRNNSMLNMLLRTLRAETSLTVALDLTGTNEKIKTLPVKKWHTIKAELPKTPAVFLFLAS